MATLYVTEFVGLGRDVSNAASQVALQPTLQEQTVSISGSSATPSNAFKNTTGLIRLHTDAICSVEFGTAPTATTSDARMAANQTEYYVVPRNAGYTVAVISNS